MLTPEEAKYLAGNSQPETEIEVTVTVCFSKTIKIKVDDYRIVDEGVDEDKCYFREDDYSCCDIYTPAKEEVYCDVKSMEEKGWDTDEFEVTLGG